MKGITHFAGGMAAAALVPGAIEMAQQGSPIIMLGGIAGVLPDTIDFKWSKFVETYDFEVDPDPLDPDPQAIADQVVAAIDAAYEADGEPVGLMIHTTRVGADAWREVVVTIDDVHQEVRCKVGGVVTTGRVPIGGTELEPRIATRKTEHPFHRSYLDTVRVNIFSGPSWELRKDGDKVHLNFIAWHRRGTHSLLFDVCLGVIGGLLFQDVTIGVAMGLAAFTHQLEDQLGFMGCSFLWPWDHRRWRGLELWHSGDPWANFSSIWMCMAILAWQINRYHPNPPIEAGLFKFFLLVVFAPLALIWICKRTWFHRLDRDARSLPRRGEDATAAEEAASLQAIKEQDVLGELGGSEGAP